MIKNLTIIQKFLGGAALVALTFMTLNTEVKSSTAKESAAAEEKPYDKMVRIQKDADTEVESSTAEEGAAAEEGSWDKMVRLKTDAVSYNFVDWQYARGAVTHSFPRGVVGTYHLTGIGNGALQEDDNIEQLARKVEDAENAVRRSLIMIELNKRTLRLDQERQQSPKQSREAQLQNRLAELQAEQATCEAQEKELGQEVRKLGDELTFNHVGSLYITQQP